MRDINENVDQFFERYAAALLARDAKAVAAMYAVPSLIIFPGKSIPVSDPHQTGLSSPPPGANMTGSTILTSKSWSWVKLPAVSGPMLRGPTVASRVSASATSSCKEPKAFK
jgi:hypothetical protein